MHKDWRGALIFIVILVVSFMLGRIAHQESTPIAQNITYVPDTKFYQLSDFNITNLSRIIPYGSGSICYRLSPDNVSIIQCDVYPYKFDKQQNRSYFDDSTLYQYFCFEKQCSLHGIYDRRKL